jgi:hypothetical protein
LLFLLSLVIAGGWYLKSNLNSMDGHVQSAGWSLPTLGVGQLSDVTGMISLMLRGPGRTAPPIGNPQDAGSGSRDRAAGIASSGSAAGTASGLAKGGRANPAAFKEQLNVARGQQ